MSDSFWKQLLRRAPVRILIAIVMVAAPVVLIRGLSPLVPGPHALVSAAADLAVAAATFAAYYTYVRVIERRAPLEIGACGAWRGVLGGALLGAGLFALAMGLLAALKVLRVTGWGSAAALAPALASAIGAGVFEELLFRGVVFRITEEALGSWLALALSAVIFGAVHFVNPHATWLGAFSIMVEAGLLLCAAFMLTRRLWLPIGLHLGWNLTQGGVFGLVVSGTAATPVLLHGELRGPIWLTGGDFGPEASIACLLVGACAGAIMLTLAARRGQILKRRASQSRLNEVPADRSTS